MFADLVLVLSELQELDPDARFLYEVENGSNGINVYTQNHEKFDLKNLSRDALEVMVRNGWRYSRDEEDDGYTNYYFQDV